MEPEPRDKIPAALRQAFEDTLYPYARVNAALARYEQQQRAEQEWWNQFLPGNSGPHSTQEVAPPGPRQVRVGYAPDAAGPLGPGEIVRTWIPPLEEVAGVYGEALLIGPETADRYYAVQMRSTSHRGARRFFPIGAGPRNDYGRFSWVDLDRLYTVHTEGVRRSGFTIDRAHFIRIADELYRRFSWPMDD